MVPRDLVHSPMSHLIHMDQILDLDQHGQYAAKRAVTSEMSS